MSKAKLYYEGLISQASTDDPTVKAEKSTIGLPVYARAGAAGVYTLTKVGAFPVDKTKIIIGDIADGNVSAVRTSDDVITITTEDLAGTNTDALLSSTLIRVEIDE